MSASPTGVATVPYLTRSNIRARESRATAVQRIHKVPNMVDDRTPMFLKGQKQTCL